MTYPKPSATILEKQGQAGLKRVFVSLKVDDAKVVDQLRSISSELAKPLRSEYHLTLRFFAGIDSQQLLGIKSQLKIICQNRPALKLCLSGVGYFSNNVAYCGLEPCSDLTDLRTAVDQASLDMGLERGDYEPWTPHITLTSRRDDKQIKARVNPNIKPVQWLADKVEIRETFKGRPDLVIATYSLSG